MNDELLQIFKEEATGYINKGLPMTRKLLIIIGLLCLFSVAQAQEEPLPVITAEELFADGIVYEEFVTSRLQYPIQWSNETRQITITDQTPPLLVSYPEDFDRIYDIKERDETSYFIFLDVVSNPDTIRIFDKINGRITDAPTVCENLVQGSYSSINWAIFESQVDNEYRLCDLTTGETSSPIPARCETYFSFIPQNYPRVSPNGEWLIFDDCRGTIYSYEVATDTFVQLGEVSQPIVSDLRYSVRWFDDFTAVLDARISNMTDSIRVYYRLDARVENSLRQFFGAASNLEPILLDNPPRYMWVDFTQARQTNEHYVEEYNILNDDYNRVFALYCATQVDIGEQPYYCGESNQALSYFAPITPDNPDYLIINGNEYEGDIPTQLTVLDSSTYDILYSVDDFQIALAWFHADKIEQLAEDSLLVAEFSDFGVRAELENLYLISFEPELQIQTLEGFPQIESLEFSYDYRRIISKTNPTETTSQYIIYDIISGENILLTNIFDPDIVDISISWFSDSLMVRLYDNQTLTYQWRVTLPE